MPIAHSFGQAIKELPGTLAMLDSFRQTLINAQKLLYAESRVCAGKNTPLNQMKRPSSIIAVSTQQ